MTNFFAKCKASDWDYFVGSLARCELRSGLALKCLGRNEGAPLKLKALFKPNALYCYCCCSLLGLLLIAFSPISSYC